MPEPEPEEATYPVRAAARLTGLSPELLRAWERRYAAIRPIRTPGGTRRYRAADLERLRLLKAAVDAGHRIGQVAELDLPALAGLVSPREPAAPADGLGAVLAAIARLDSDESRRLLSLQLSSLGPVRFARDFALPLVYEIGERWARGDLSIASEHLASALLRAMLGSALTPSTASRLGPRILFATPSGERHELGLQIAALTAMGAGAHPIYLGAELPVEELLRAVEALPAETIALSVVTLPPADAIRAVKALRGALPRETRVWLGGARAAGLVAVEGVECIESLDALEQRVALLRFEGRP